MKLRRVVTGFDKSGKAVVSSDRVLDDMDIPGGMKVTAVWAYEDEVDFDTPNLVENGVPKNFGTNDVKMNWGVAELPPGMKLGMHSTQTVDLITVLEGEVTCVLDTGEVITLRAHEVMLQRGVLHQWENRGKVRCVWTYATLKRFS